VWLCACGGGSVRAFPGLKDLEAVSHPSRKRECAKWPNIRTPPPRRRPGNRPPQSAPARTPAGNPRSCTIPEFRTQTAPVTYLSPPRTPLLPHASRRDPPSRRSHVPRVHACASTGRADFRSSFLPSTPVLRVRSPGCVALISAPVFPPASLSIRRRDAPRAGRQVGVRDRTCMITWGSKLSAKAG